MKKQPPPTSLEGMVPLFTIRIQIPLSKRAVIHWAATGKIPAKKIGGRWFAVPKDVHAAIVNMAESQP